MAAFGVLMVAIIALSMRVASHAEVLVTGWASPTGR